MISISKSNYQNYCKNQNDFNKNIEVSFGSLEAPLYAIVKPNVIKTILPTAAFIGSVTAALGYFIGGAGLFYDSNKEKSIKKKPFVPPPALTNYKYFYNPAKSKSEGGVNTIKATTKAGKACMSCAKVGIAASSMAGLTCGLGEGLPLMAIGEATSITSSPIIETPIGTGLFGIGLASTYSALALDNTPELKINPLHLMAESNTLNKIKIIAKNTKVAANEMLLSVKEIALNIFNPKFFKENIFSITPKTIIFEEFTNKDGLIKMSKALRHNKNYVMHAASFVLALGGASLISTSLLNAKKAQKASLKVQEGGFLFDNFGMTRYGIDKLSTGGKATGASFVAGGVINAISNFMQLDNKEGRATQWLGISLVFLGFSMDRGKFLRKELAKLKARPELTDLVRQWKFDLSELVKNDPKELKNLLKEIKSGKTITNQKFIDFENNFNKAFEGSFKNTDETKAALEKSLGKDTLDKFKVQEINDYEKTKEVLSICTEKMFGNKNPTPIN